MVTAKFFVVFNASANRFDTTPAARMHFQAHAAEPASVCCTGSIHLPMAAKEYGSTPTLFLRRASRHHGRPMPIKQHI
jgi:hypothetical protein